MTVVVVVVAEMILKKTTTEMCMIILFVLYLFLLALIPIFVLQHECHGLIFLNYSWQMLHYLYVNNRLLFLCQVTFEKEIRGEDQVGN